MKPLRLGGGSRAESHGVEKDARPVIIFEDQNDTTQPSQSIELVGGELHVFDDPEGPNRTDLGSIPGSGGGGGGQVDEVRPGDFIDVDSSDPAKPIVSVAISGSPSAGDYPGYDGSGGLEWTTPSGGGSALPYITGLAQDCDLSDPLTFSPSLTLHNGGTSNRWAVLIGAAPDGITVDPADGSHTGNTTSGGIFDWTIAATPLDGSFAGHTAISHQRITVLQQGLLPNSVVSCTGWLDATDPSTMFTDFSATIPVTTDGQTVQRMLDKASSHLWQVNNTPVYNTSVLNGQSVLSFDQGDYVRQSSGNISSLITAASHTIIIVARWQDVVNTGIGYGSAAKLVADAGLYMGVHLATSPNRVALYNYDGSEQYAEVSQAQNTWVIISVQHGGGNIRCRVNRGAWTTVASGNTGSLVSITHVGAVGSSGWSSRIQQIAFFNTQLGDSDLEGVEDYFAWVSGISLP